MMNTNARIEEELANGTPCRGLYIKLKMGCEFEQENWERTITVMIRVFKKKFIR